MSRPRRSNSSAHQVFITALRDALLRGAVD